MFCVKNLEKFPAPHHFWGFHEGNFFQLLEDAAVSTWPNDALEEVSETQTSNCGVWAPSWNCSGAKEGKVVNRIIMFWTGSTEIQKTKPH